jgi:hypothetical protein
VPKLQWLAGFALALLPAAAQTAGEIHGGIADARGGEALANVQVQLAGTAYRTVSDAGGRFAIGGILAGDYTLNVSTVGYHLAKHAFHLDAGESKEFRVALAPDTLRQTEKVQAKADPFETARADSPDALTLAGNDAKNLGSVLADDPLRAVQSLPGVTSDNDFDARFSLRGADYSRIGLYVDGVLLHAPFHMLQGQSTPGSATAFNGDMVDQMELHEGAFPSRFGDRSAGVLDIDTRDGNRDATTFRAAASMSNAGFLAEGPIRKGKRGSWLVALRKSYLQYILERTFPDNSFVFGFEDLQARFSYDLTAGNSLTFSAMESYSSLDRSSDKPNLGVNSVMEAGYHYTLVNLGWRYSPNARLSIVNHAAWMRERYNDTTPTPLPLSGGFYGEWVWNASATWLWSSAAPFEAGWSVRRLRDQDYSNQYNTAAGAPRVLDHADGTALRLGGYVQQSWAGFEGRLRLTAGARWDGHSTDRVSAVSPQASAAIGITKSTRIQLGWGEYAQYPELSVLYSTLGNRGLLPTRSIHAVAAVERRLGRRTRLRAEFYDRADRDLPFQPYYEPRISNGKVFSPPVNPLYYNSLRGYSRGAEIFLQRSSANRFTGWISYAYGHAMMREGVSNQRFPSDYDQRHTISIYGGYRLRPTVNLSVHSSYGSGFPIPGYLTEIAAVYYLAPARNQIRLPSYERTDFRVNKSWLRAKWKLTLYGELVNLTNRTNYVFESLNGYNTKTGQISITLDKTFPILPSVGTVVEW